MIRNLYFFIKYLLSIPLNRIKGNTLDSTVRISRNVNISRSSIGKYNYIATNVNIIYARIGNYCSIAPGVQIGGMEHSYWWKSTSTFLSDKCISGNITVIEDDVWIAAGSIIKQGVKIGRGSVIGAMSFVNKDIPPNSIVFGSPAKIFKKRFSDNDFTLLEESKYWEYEPSKAMEILHKLNICE